MADPVVHITAGIPDAGTGNITTLGQTLLDGANATLGITTDAAIVAGAAGTINAHLRSISRDIASGVVLQAGGNLIGNVGQGSPPWSQNLTQFGGAAVVTGTGIGGAGIPRVTVSSDSSLAATQSGTWNINNIAGTVSLPTGASTSAKQPNFGTGGVPSADVLTVQGVGSMTPLKVDGSAVTQPVSGTVTANQGTAGAAWPVTLTSTTITGVTSVGGNVGSGSSDSGNPVKIGGLASTANPTPVTGGQRTNATFDKLGKQVCVGAIRSLMGVQKTSITTSTETTVVTAIAATFVDVYAIIVTNKSATSVWVDFRDASAGTVRMTLAAPAGDTRGFTVTVDSAMPQAAGNNNWTATVSSAVTSIEITMLYVQNL